MCAYGVSVEQRFMSAGSKLKTFGKRESEMEDLIITVGEAAKLLGVHSKTLSKWATEGKISHIRTLGGHRRFYLSQVMTVLQNQTKMVD